MTDLLQIFSGNPLTTFVGKKIEAATRPELESEDWALNMDICDIINENDDDAKDAVRAIRKRLQQVDQDTNFAITNRTLTVLETCVSNCTLRFHVHVMTKDFIQDLVKLIGPKNNPPVELQERVLSLIERWAEAFKSQPCLGGVVAVYNDLKAKGVTFPERDPSSTVPIQTPQRSIPSPPRQSIITPQQQQHTQPAPQPQQNIYHQQQQPQQQPIGQVVLEGEGYNKISQDLTVVQSSIEMFTDIMQVLESPANEESDWKLADELNITSRQMKDRIVDLIERVANEDLTIELLRLNDELNNIFIKYDRLVKNKSKLASTSATNTTNKEQQQSSNAGQPANQPMGVSSRTLNDLSLIDFNATSKQKPTDELAGTTTAEALAPHSTPSISDPFDTSNLVPQPAAAKKDQSIAESLGKLNLGSSGSGAGINKEGSEFSEGKTRKLPEEISSVREQDFAEIENWLATDSGRDLASIGGDVPSMEPISIPNSEFENFLANRALAGSNAPSTQQQQQQSKTSIQKPEPSV